MHELQNARKVARRKSKSLHQPTSRDVAVDGELVQVAHPRLVRAEDHAGRQIVQALPEPAGHFPISTISDQATIGQAGSTWRRKTALGHFKHVEGGDEAIRNLQATRSQPHRSVTCQGATLRTVRGSAGCAQRGVRVVVQASVRSEDRWLRREGAHLIAACVRAASCGESAGT